MSWVEVWAEIGGSETGMWAEGECWSKLLRTTSSTASFPLSGVSGDVEEGGEGVGVDWSMC